MSPSASESGIDDQRSAARELVAAIDGSAISDGRRAAGIGRYAAELIGALRELDGGFVPHVAAPRSEPLTNRWLYRWARAQPALAALIRRVRPDVVHGLASEAAVCFPLGRQVVTVHDVIPWTTPQATVDGTRAYLAAQRLLLRRAGAVIVVSDGVGRDAVRELGVSPERIVTVPHGVSSSFAANRSAADDAALTAAGLGREAYVLWVGSLHGPDSRKGLDLLFDAVSSLDAESRPVVALVGKSGLGSDWARRAARAAAIELVLPGFVEDSQLAALYRGAAAAIVPSRYEGFGLPALEALACGAPLLVTDAGNLPNVVGEAAVVVPADDAGALAGGLRAILGDQELRARLRAAGPLRAQQFSWRRAASLTVDVYERVRSGRLTA